jgi:hypothetical protein
MIIDKHRQLLEKGKFKEANELFIKHAPEGALKEASKAMARAIEYYETAKFDEKIMRGLKLE